MKDTSGAILPGVTVEAASDALIEKMKSVVTDGNGQYRIVDLRPGSYVVTFTLPGFQTIKRDGIDLPGQFTATVDVDMKVGSLEETIVVTGAAPMVDVQSAAHVQTLDRQAIDDLPTGRTIQGIGQMIVGISLSLPDVGGSRAAMQTYMSVRGNPAANNTILVDGMVVNGLEANGAVQSYFNDQMSQEMSYQTSGIDASTSSGGVKLNMIPKEGGNRFSGSSTLSYRPGAWQGDNLTPRLKAAGIAASNTTDYIFDLTGSQGGPIMKDKIWFFVSGREYRTNNGVTNTFQNDGSQGKDLNFIRDGLARGTYQMNNKAKFSGYYDRITKYRSNDMQSLYDPETAARVWTSPNYSTGQIKYTGALTSKFLVEAGWALNIERRNTEMQPGVEKERGTPEWFAGATYAAANTTLGGASNSAFTSGSEWPDRYSYSASAAYVTGSHNIKGGFNGTYGTFYHEVRANADLYQEYASVNTAPHLNGGGDIGFSNPISVVVRNTPVSAREDLNRDMGFYIQDTFTMKRVTLSGGIRYEILKASIGAATAGAGRFVPERTSPRVDGYPDWTNWAPRFQAIWDVFGNSKTAIKYSANVYNAAQTTSIADGFNPLAPASQRLNWTDLNGDNIAQGGRTWNAAGTAYTDCVYLTAGCEINLTQLRSNFGLPSDPGIYAGFPRGNSFEQGLEVQHELFPRLSVTGTYYHGNFRNLTTTINRAVTPADYTPFTVFNPIDGSSFTAYSQSAASISRAADNISYLDKDRRSEFSAYSAEFRARIGRGATLFGGVQYERSLANGTSSTANCTVGLLQNPNLLRFCDEKNLEDGSRVPVVPNFRLNGSYPLPWYGLIFSATFQSNDGGSLAQSINITRSARYPDGSGSFLVGNQPAPACPAPCPAGALINSTLGQATLTMPLRAGSVARNERLNQVDIKIGKTFRVGRMTIAPNFEAFNLNNTDKVITWQSTSYAIAAGTYMRPNSITQGRILGIGTNVRW